MYTPENIIKLNENEIFVFGSNGLGYHLGGAAKIAMDKFGAIFGISEGIQGQSFAINTMYGIEKIKEGIRKLFIYATKHRDKIFLFTKIGCGIAGYKENEIKSILPKQRPQNILFPVGR